MPPIAGSHPPPPSNSQVFKPGTASSAAAQRQNTPTRLAHVLAHPLRAARRLLRRRQLLGTYSLHCGAATAGWRGGKRGGAHGEEAGPLPQRLDGRQRIAGIDGAYKGVGVADLQHISHRLHQGQPEWRLSGAGACAGDVLYSVHCSAPRQRAFPAQVPSRNLQPALTCTSSSAAALGSTLRPKVLDGASTCEKPRLWPAYGKERQQVDGCHGKLAPCSGRLHDSTEPALLRAWTPPGTATPCHWRTAAPLPPPGLQSAPPARALGRGHQLPGRCLRPRLWRLPRPQDQCRGQPPAR